MDAIIETQDLSKHYGDFVAVDRLNLQVHEGEVFGVLGPNGAGKTTTILMLLGLTEPTSGVVRVAGLDPGRQPLSVKAQVGYIPEQVGFYEHLTARENLVYTAKLNGLSRELTRERIESAMERVGLSDALDHEVRTFSRGMRQRLGLADVLVKAPRIIIMDEPTQGLDPERALEFLELIRSLREEDVTILLASHLLYQVQAVCDRVGLFYRGQMVLQGTVPDLARQVLGGAYRIQLELATPDDAVVEAIRRVPGVVSVHPLNGQGYEVEARDDIRPAVARAAIQAGAQLLRLDIRAQNLDDIYTAYFGEVRDDNASTTG